MRARGIGNAPSDPDIRHEQAVAQGADGVGRDSQRGRGQERVRAVEETGGPAVEPEDDEGLTFFGCVLEGYRREGEGRAIRPGPLLP